MSRQKSSSSIRVGIVGAKAYTAGVLLDLLLAHPNVVIAALAGRDPEPVRTSDFFPELRGRLETTPCAGLIEPFDADDMARRCDAVFLTLPHKAAAETAKALYDRDVTVIDLSADFRFSDNSLYAQTYGHAHPYPDLNPQVPYALAEIEGRSLEGQKLVAVPGCYPTSVLIPIIPLLKADLISTSWGIIADCKSGVSGAGRQATDVTHFCATNESFGAYGIGAHRHRPEIAEKAMEAAGHVVSVAFTPHLVPMDRGILSTIYVRPTREGIGPAEVHAAWRDAYGHWPLVRVNEGNPRPGTKAVLRTGFIDIAAYRDNPTGLLILVSALDNLMKGASSQALQAFNLMHGLPDARGILPGV